MILSSIEKIAKDIGYDIGASYDQIQADLLNGFCKGLSNSMTKDKLETQMCYIADKLDNQTLSVLKGLVEFIEIKNENKK